MSSTPRTISSSLQAYRALLRASRIAFQGDVRTTTLSLKQIRSEFEKNRFEKDETKLQKLVSDANEAAQFLMLSVLQGVKEEGQDMKIKLNKKQVEANLDATVTIKEIDDQYMGSLERRAGRKKNRSTDSDATNEESEKTQQ